MTAEALKTKDSFTATFPSFLDGRSGDPAWLKQVREEAFASFSEQGFPTRRDEAWKYTNVKAIAEGEFQSSPTVESAGIASLVDRSHFGGPRVVLVNGHFSAELSNLDAAKHVTIRPVATAMESLQATVSNSSHAETPFSSLNTAFFTDGATIEIEAGHANSVPLELIVVTTDGAASYPRVSVVVGATSESTLLETHIGPGESTYLNDTVVDVTLHDGAILRHVKLIDESSSGFHVATTRAVLSGRDCRYSSNVITLSGAIARHDVVVTVDAEGAHADLDGLYLANGEQQVDNHTTIDHAKPRTTSSENYRGVLDDSSRGTFFGRIIVRPDAQKISAEQQNKNLLLSNDALANSTPQLEIYADDVKCAHGSTIGQLDPNALFYLRSRGLDQPTARDLLTYAFANDILDRIPVVALRERLAARLLARIDSDARSEL